MKIVKIIVMIVLVIAILGGGVATYLSVALPTDKPVENLTIEKTAARLERGAYLSMHVAACIDCHSKRDWTLFSGPVIQGTLGMGGELFDKAKGFPGEIHTPNITPYAIRNWSDGELLRAITTGVNKDGKAIFPLMAYQRFGMMDKEDIYSIIAYLRSLAPVENNVPQSSLDFPVNLLNNLNPKNASFQNLPDKNDVTAYGKYLVNAAGCVDCHSKNEKGKIVAGSEFGGGMKFSQPAGVMRAPNITMHNKTGIGSYTMQSFVQRFKIYADSNYQSPKVGIDDLNSPMPWTMYAGMKTKDLEAIYTYLKSAKPINNFVEVRSLKKK